MTYLHRVGGALERRGIGELMSPEALEGHWSRIASRDETAVSREQAPSQRDAITHHPWLQFSTTTCNNATALLPRPARVPLAHHSRPDTCQLRSLVQRLVNSSEAKSRAAWS